MLDTIQTGFKNARNLLKGERELTENNIDLALKEIKISLLDADVSFDLVKSFLKSVKEKAVGTTVTVAIKDAKGKKHKLSPHDHFVRIAYDELLAMMGPQFAGITFAHKNPTCVLMAGLQGSGKTTSSGKLAKYFLDMGKKALLVAADTFRAGAVEQLKSLGSKLNVPVFHLENESALTICVKALAKGRQENFDVVIFDTQGRLSIDDELMGDLLQIKNAVQPHQTFLVVDAMIGQDAVTTAKGFNEKIDIDAVIMTKLDGDARGGAALSIRNATQKPIAFLGMGEDLKSLEIFRPEGIASRILGMGDIVSLSKDFEKNIDEKEAIDDANKFLKGQFTFDDFQKQLSLMKKIGSLKSIIDRIPGMSDMLPKETKIDDKQFLSFSVMIQSMTKQERKFPSILEKQKRRLERIAKGSGHSLEQVSELLERFLFMKKMMGSLGKNPQKMLSHPMFDGLKKASSFGSANPFAATGLDMGGQFGGNSQMMAPAKNKKIMSSKVKKDKRKAQKNARKKGKKK